MARGGAPFGTSSFPPFLRGRMVSRRPRRVEGGRAVTLRDGCADCGWSRNVHVEPGRTLLMQAWDPKGFDKGRKPPCAAFVPPKEVKL